ncbi:STAS domain-containing protein [Kitasatospora sp. McL0602]|uniref:STAS domain-containing protein n=1 Tax=Kitasatospora sp. McL0602 TaxID=3439530 RepID=UPI003F8ACFE8
MRDNLARPGPPPSPNTGRLTVALRTDGGTVVVSPAGELDYDSADLLRERLREAVGLAAERVVLDCRDLSFCDSTGLNLLLGARLDAAEARVTLILAGLQASVARVFEITGTDAVFDIRPDVTAAAVGLHTARTRPADGRDTGEDE